MTFFVLCCLDMNMVAYDECTSFPLFMNFSCSVLSHTLFTMDVFREYIRVVHKNALVFMLFKITFAWKISLNKNTIYRIERTKTNILVVGNDFVLHRFLQGFWSTYASTCNDEKIRINFRINDFQYHNITFFSLKIFNTTCELTKRGGARTLEFRLRGHV